MKRIHLYAVNFVLLLFSACSSNNDDIQDNGISSATLSIEVFAGDFVETGNTATRAFDNENVTTFEAGDRIGIIVLGKDESVLPGNIPYKYNPSSKTWTSAASSEGKEAIIYDSKATYLAYFPYSPKADHVKNIDELKEIFKPLSDQQTEEDYRASDLLVWEGKPIETGTTGLNIKKILRINFQHAYSSLSLLPSIACKINNNKDFTYTTSSIDKVSFTVNNMGPFEAYKADDGIYRIIIPPQEEETTIHWSCMYEGATCNGTAKSSTLSENTRYKIVSTVKDIGIYNEKQTKAGDFYCIDEDTKNGYLIPGEATSLPSDVKCIGIVYWTGDVTGDNYGLLDKQYSHGLVVSSQHLIDPDKSSEKMSWTYGSMESVMEVFNEEWFESMDLSNYDLQDEKNMQGYVNTQVLQKYNDYVKNSNDEKYGQDSKYRIKPISVLEYFKQEYPSSQNSSGWYWPSACELDYINSKDEEDTRTLLKNINDQFKKIGGNNLEETYWTSTEKSANNAYFVTIDSRTSDRPKTNTYYVRPILAF